MQSWNKLCDIVSDIDECHISDNVCANGTCHNQPGRFACTCSDGFKPVMLDQMCEGESQHMHRYPSSAPDDWLCEALLSLAWQLSTVNPNLIGCAPYHWLSLQTSSMKVHTIIVVHCFLLKGLRYDCACCLQNYSFTYFIQLFNSSDFFFQNANFA